MILSVSRHRKQIVPMLIHVIVLRNLSFTWCVILLHHLRLLKLISLRLFWSYVDVRWVGEAIQVLSVNIYRLFLLMTRIDKISIILGILWKFMILTLILLCLSFTTVIQIAIKLSLLRRSHHHGRILARSIHFLGLNCHTLLIDSD